MKKFAILFVAVLFTALNLFADEPTPSTAGTGEGTVQLTVVYPDIICVGPPAAGDFIGTLNPGDTYIVDGMTFTFSGAKGVTGYPTVTWGTHQWFTCTTTTAPVPAEFEQGVDLNLASFSLDATIYCKPGTPRAEYLLKATMTVDYQ